MGVQCILYNLRLHLQFTCIFPITGERLFKYIIVINISHFNFKRHNFLLNIHADYDLIKFTHLIAERQFQTLKCIASLQ